MRRFPSSEEVASDLYAMTKRLTHAPLLQTVNVCTGVSRQADERRPPCPRGRPLGNAICTEGRSVDRSVVPEMTTAGANRPCSKVEGRHTHTRRRVYGKGTDGRLSRTLRLSLRLPSRPVAFPGRSQTKKMDGDALAD